MIRNKKESKERKKGAWGGEREGRRGRGGRKGGKRGVSRQEEEAVTQRKLREEHPDIRLCTCAHSLSVHSMRSLAH